MGEVTGRTASGSRYYHRSALKARGSLTTTLLDPSIAEALNIFLDGLHDVWSFDDDSLSAKGYGWTSTVPALDTTNKLFGTSAMTVASAAEHTCGWQESVLRTVLVWRRSSGDSTSFQHYAFHLNGSSYVNKYKNGAVTAESTGLWCVANANGSISLKGKNNSGGNAVIQYDDLVMVPGHVPLEMIVAFANATNAWASPPYLNLNGNAFNDTAALVHCMRDDNEYAQGVSPTTGTYVSNLQAITCEFEEY